MNTLQLSSGGFDEMTFDETRETDGGVFWVPFLAVLISAINNFGDIRDGYYDATHGLPPRHHN